MIDQVKFYAFSSYIGIFLYWLPLLLCIYGYTVRTWTNYRKDLVECQKQAYFPTDTLGTLLGRALISVCPIANLCAATFDIGPSLFSSFFKYLGLVFDFPLVKGKYVKPTIQPGEMIIDPATKAELTRYGVAP